MKGLTLEAIALCCNGEYFGDEASKSQEITDVAIDSRKVVAGGLFIAIKGERSDGHDYIRSCFENGVLCCISERELPADVSCGHAYIKVESSLQAIKDIAAFYRKILGTKVVGITGSVGKTSTKETVYSVLSKKYNCIKTLGNFNNEIGLPLTIFRITEDTEIAVLEMGISEFGEMTRLTNVAKPDTCVITNVGYCHLENLGSRDGVLKAKTEIFSGMSKNGNVILNGDDDKLVTVKEVNGKSVCFFGIDNRSGIYADNIENLGLEGMRCTIHNVDTADGVRNFEVTIPVPGMHMVYNAMAAASVGAVYGLTSEEIICGLEGVETIAGRNHIIKANGLLILDDCYNANPVSMKASIDVISSAAGRKVCILGDMFELGTEERQLHYGVGEYLASKNIDVLITAGELSANIAQAVLDYKGRNECLTEVYSFTTRDELMENLKSLIREGDNILVKASHGMEFSRVIEMLQDIR